MPLEYEHAEPSSGADPDHRPYEGQVTAACDGVELPGLDSNQRVQGSGPCRGRKRPTRHCVRKARFERASHEV
jgi:hypothetical protein